MNVFLKDSLICLTIPWLLMFFISLVKGKRWKHTSIYFVITSGIALCFFYFLHYDTVSRLSNGGVPMSAKLILVFSKLVLALWVVVIVLQRKGILRYGAENFALALSAALAVLLNWSIYEHI